MFCILKRMIIARLILPMRYASALCLMLGASRIVVLHTMIVVLSSQALTNLLGANQAHHLYVKVPAALLGLLKKQVFSTKNRIYSMSELHHIDVFLDTL